MHQRQQSAGHHGRSLPSDCESRLDVRGTIAYCNDHAETIKLVEEGKINLEPFITQRIKLDELVSEGFERLIHNNESAVKIIVNPNL